MENQTFWLMALPMVTCPGRATEDVARKAATAQMESLMMELRVVSGCTTFREEGKYYTGKFEIVLVSSEGTEQGHRLY